ncbi:MAG: hypothetical protein ACREQM_18975 [Candidatus Dormibacteraceae bacterium]
MSRGGVIIVPPRLLARRRLIAQTGLVLVVLLGAEVLTVPFLSDGLVPLHIGLGLGAIPALLLKLATTGARAFRYHRGDLEERTEGPPDDLLRITAVVLVLTTVTLFGSGIVLWMFGLGVAPSWLVGPYWLLIHELSFIGWAFAAAVHGLSYATRAVRWALDDWSPASALAGAVRRHSWVLGVLAAGLAIALLLTLLRIGAQSAFG